MLFGPFYPMVKKLIKLKEAVYFKLRIKNFNSARKSYKNPP